MRRFALTAIAAALSLGAAGATSANTNVTTDPRVSVTIGEALAKKTSSYGPRDIELAARWLDEAATHAVSRPGSQIERADLVLEDAVPNRPTFSQMGRNVQLSMLGSVGLGGARIGGTVTTTDGVVHPVSYAWYENWLWNTVGATTWRDAERAFQMFSSRIAKGDIPQQKRLMQPSGTGDFGAWRANRYR